MATERRIAASLAILATLAALTLMSCGGRPQEDVAFANADLVDRLLDLPGANAVRVERYGYDTGDDEAGDDFFTEVEYTTDATRHSGAVLDAVGERLGEGWQLSVTAKSDCCAAATFQRDDARVEITTWDGGFDIAVASEGARLDGTHLGLGR